MVQACDGGPITTLLLATWAMGATTARVLEQTNSADAGGASDYVVGYGVAAVFTDSTQRPFSLSKSERSCLGDIARDAVKQAVSGAPQNPIRHSLCTLHQPGGAFVTLYCQGDLRGCMGDIHVESHSASQYRAWLSLPRPETHGSLLFVVTSSHRSRSRSQSSGRYRRSPPLRHPGRNAGHLGQTEPETGLAVAPGSHPQSMGT
jgi:hypothetical protein